MELYSNFSFIVAISYPIAGFYDIFAPVTYPEWCGEVTRNMVIFSSDSAVTNRLLYDKLCFVSKREQLSAYLCYVNVKSKAPDYMFLYKCSRNCQMEDFSWLYLHGVLEHYNSYNSVFSQCHDDSI